MSKLYCFDTSTFIRAWYEAYAPDVVESFWEHLGKAIKAGTIIAPDEVLRETSKRSNDLHAWLKQHEQCFVEIDDELQEAVSSLLQRFPLLAKNRKGASSADAWVIALAQIRNATVVSEESPLDSEKKPKIPGVCRQVDVSCTNLLEFMRSAKWKL